MSFLRVNHEELVKSISNAKKFVRKLNKKQNLENGYGYPNSSPLDYVLFEFFPLYLRISATDGFSAYRKKINYYSGSTHEGYSKLVVDVKEFDLKNAFSTYDVATIQFNEIDRYSIEFRGSSNVFLTNKIDVTYPDLDEVVRVCSIQEDYLELCFSEMLSILKEHSKHKPLTSKNGQYNLVAFKINSTSPDSLKRNSFYEALNCDSYSDNSHNFVKKNLLELTVQSNTKDGRILFNSKKLRNAIEVYKSERKMHKKRYLTDFYIPNYFRIFFNSWSGGINSYKMLASLKTSDCEIFLMPIVNNEIF